MLIETLLTDCCDLTFDLPDELPSSTLDPTHLFHSPSA
jgi:hypothetical protein